MKSKHKEEIVLGLMSGTSCDGLDIAACTFLSGENNRDSYIIHACKTISFSDDLKHRLLTAAEKDGVTLRILDRDFSEFMANSVSTFIQETQIQPDYISSHGHTVFHQPKSGYTLQIGSGAILSALTGIDTVCDFRQADVSLGGQGAPLVPVGDRFLFSEMDYCLNLGGFANITINTGEPLRAFDICSTNLVLNYLARRAGREYDAGGTIASFGQVSTSLLEKLNRLAYYQLPAPKSLGVEWMYQELMPIIKSFEQILTTEDLLCTYTEHIAVQISKYVKGKEKKCIVTGGGVWNLYLTERIKKHSEAEIIIPDENLVNFKEALVFAYLGWLRMNNRINIFNSVTGSVRNSVSGAIYLG